MDPSGFTTLLLRVKYIRMLSDTQPSMRPPARSRGSDNPLNAAPCRPHSAPRTAPRSFRDPRLISAERSTRVLPIFCSWFMLFQCTVESLRAQVDMPAQEDIKAKAEGGAPEPKLILILVRDPFRSYLGEFSSPPPPPRPSHPRIPSPWCGDTSLCGLQT